MEFLIEKIITDRSLNGFTEYQILSEDGLKFSVRINNVTVPMISKETFKELIIIKYKDSLEKLTAQNKNYKIGDTIEIDLKEPHKGTSTSRTFQKHSKVT